MQIKKVQRASGCNCEAYPFCEHAPNATAGTMAKAIGKIGNINQGGLNIDVKILDVKQSYGQARYLVTPMAGCESVWVAANRVRFADEVTLEVMEDSQ